jgi:hypothetical protein
MRRRMACGVAPGPKPPDSVWSQPGLQARESLPAAYSEKTTPAPLTARVQKGQGSLIVSVNHFRSIWVWNAQRCKRLYFKALHTCRLRASDLMVMPQKVQVAMNQQMASGDRRG